LFFLYLVLGLLLLSLDGLEQLLGLLGRYSLTLPVLILVLLILILIHAFATIPKLALARIGIPCKIFFDDDFLLQLKRKNYPKVIVTPTTRKESKN
ncbi:MAG: hypothetical protein IJQ82_14560, partial [Selenomonadaceae bacterium]|nr:hypothetical protein [Selenomonadaceae bacterium]